MVYRVIKTIARLALKIFCREISVTGEDFLAIKGPVLVTANHPNSFFDAIVIGALFRKPVHFLARGDAFKKPWHGKLLRLLNMIPIYRLSEGRENLGLNENAFQQSRKILSEGGIVLIFIEGVCVNKHALQPFKKGAAKIASESKQLPGFKILPVSIAYNSFRDFGKLINIHIAEPIATQTLFQEKEDAKNTRYFNEVLFDVIGKNISIPTEIHFSTLAKTLLLIPAIIGFVLHIIPYLLVKTLVQKKTRGTVFYDSVLFGVLLIGYPIFLLIICAVLVLAGVSFLKSLLIIITLPILACCAVRLFGGTKQPVYGPKL